MKLASSLLAARVAASASGDAAAAGDCLKQAAPGPELLTTPEPRFYVLGSKSYGRSSSFLLSLGHQQVSAVVGMLQAELLHAAEAAAEADGAAAGGAAESGAAEGGDAGGEPAAEPTAEPPAVA